MKNRIFTKPLLKVVIPVVLVASIAVWFLSPGVHSLFGCVFHSNIERKCYLYDYDTEVFSGETTFTLSGFGLSWNGLFYGNCSVSGYPTDDISYSGESPSYLYHIYIDKNDFSNIMILVIDSSTDAVACFLSSDSDSPAKEQYEYWVEKFGFSPLSETESLEGSS